MAYYGEHLHRCLVHMFDWNVTQVIIVSGDSWNPCGHAMLRVGASPNAYYFHVAPPVISKPRYMREDGFQRYLEEHGKKVLDRIQTHIPYPEKAQAKLDELLNANWIWLAIPSNCASFVERVIQAGGSQLGTWLQCPTSAWVR